MFAEKNPAAWDDLLDFLIELAINDARNEPAVHDEKIEETACEH
jgi:hypothetical protein